MTSARLRRDAVGRRQRVLDAARKWADSLIDQTGRNELLYCRDRGKLLLDDAPPAALARLLTGRKVRLKELFPDPEDHAQAAKDTESIRRRIKEYDEERGVSVGRVAYAFATWDQDLRWRAEAGDPGQDAREGGRKAHASVRSPVLLRSVTITRAATGFGDHELTADPDVEINPVLAAHLERLFKVSLDRTLLDELNDQVDDPTQIELALERLRQSYSAVPGFKIEPGVLVGTFHYAKLAMFEDLRANAESYVDNDLFAAIAGDEEAILPSSRRRRGGPRPRAGHPRPRLRRSRCRPGTRTAPSEPSPSRPYRSPAGRVPTRACPRFVAPLRSASALCGGICGPMWTSPTIVVGCRAPRCAGEVGLGWCVLESRDARAAATRLRRARCCCGVGAPARTAFR